MSKEGWIALNSAPAVWEFDTDDMTLSFAGCPFALVRDQYDTEAGGTPEGEEWDESQRRLGERIADALNQAHVTPDVPKARRA